MAKKIRKNIRYKARSSSEVRDLEGLMAVLEEQVFIIGSRGIVVEGNSEKVFIYADRQGDKEATIDSVSPCKDGQKVRIVQLGPRYALLKISGQSTTKYSIRFGP